MNLEQYELKRPLRKNVAELISQGWEFVYEIDDEKRIKYKLVCKGVRIEHDLLLMKKVQITDYFTNISKVLNDKDKAPLNIQLKLKN